MTKKLVFEPHAYFVDKNSLPDVPLYYLPLPEKWISFLAPYVMNEKNIPKFQLSSLEKKLFSVFPDLVSINSIYRELKEHKPWIIAVKTISIEWIKNVCKSWFQFICEKNSIQLPADLFDVQWEWSSLEIGDYLEDNSYKYSLIPGVFAHQFCKETVHINVTDMDLDFYPVHTGSVRECMSEPIETKHGDFYSYVIRLQLKNRAGQTDKNYLTVKTVIRRFQMDPLIKDGKCYLPAKRKASLFIALDNLYEEKKGQIYVRLKVARSKGETFTKWQDSIEQVFLDHIMQGSTFSTDELLKNPRKYADGTYCYKVFMVYSQQTVKVSNIKVKPGAGMMERRELFHKFKDCFPNLIPLTFAKEVKLSNMNSNLMPWIHLQKEELRLEVWSEDKNLFQQSIKVIREIFENQLEEEEINGERILLQSDQDTGETIMTLRVVSHDSGDIVSELNNDSEQEKEQKIRFIQKTLKKAHKENPIMSLIEIKAFEKISDDARLKDPKKTLRLGMAATGRITQFIHPLEEDEGNFRIKNALLDLFMDRGFFKDNWKKLNPEGHFIGINIVHVNQIKGKSFYKSFLPILSWVHDGKVFLKKYGDAQWLPLENALVSIDRANLKNSLINKPNPQVLKAFLKNEIGAIIRHTEGKVYLFADASLRRHWWYEIQNGKIEQDVLSLFDGLIGKERIRLIRINTTEDVPYYDLMKGNEIKISTGLFKDDCGVYYSVGLRPDTMRAAKSAVKAKTPTKVLAKQLPVEMMPLGCLDDEERDRVVELSHHLRRVNLTYEKHTKLPFPLQRIKAIEKYLDSVENEYEYDHEDILCEMEEVEEIEEVEITVE